MVEGWGWVLEWRVCKLNLLCLVVVFLRLLISWWWVFFGFMLLFGDISKKIELKGWEGGWDIYVLFLLGCEEESVCWGVLRLFFKVDFCGFIILVFFVIIYCFISDCFLGLYCNYCRYCCCCLCIGLFVLIFMLVCYLIIVVVFFFV